MKKFTKITLIIAAVFACVGIALCCVATTVAGGTEQLRKMAQSGELNFGNWHFEDGVYYQNENFLENIASVTLNEETLLGGTDNLETTFEEEIKRIELDLDIANVVVKPNDQEWVSVSMENGLKKHYSEELDGDKLIVTYDVNGKNYKNAPDIVVYVPKDLILEELQIEADLGNVEVCEFAQGCEKVDITAKMGNIEVRDSIIEEKCKLKANMGNAQMTNVTCHDAEAHAAMGAVSFEGVVKGDLRLTADMGKASATVDGDESDYNLYLYADMGQIHCNGKAHHSEHHNSKYECENAGAIGDIYLESDMGEVELNFR